jgi:hypothetical protein
MNNEQLLDHWNQTHYRALEETEQAGSSILFADCLRYALLYTSQNPDTLSDEGYQVGVLAAAAREAYGIYEKMGVEEERKLAERLFQPA